MLGLILYTLVACDNSEVVPTNIDGRLTDLEALAEAQAAQIAALQAQVATLETADAASRLTTLETELSVGGDPGFVSRIDALDGGLVSVDARLTAFDADLETRIEDATGQAVSRALSDVPASGGSSYFQRLVDASNGVEALTARADVLEAAVFETDDETGALELDADDAPIARLLDVLERLDALEGGGTTLGSLLDVVDGRLDALDTLTGALEAAVYETDELGVVVEASPGVPLLRVDALGEFVDTLDAALAAVESRVVLAETALVSIDDELTTTDTSGDPARVLAQLQAAVAQMVTSTQLADAVADGDDAIWDVLGRTPDAPTLGTNVRQAIADLRMYDQNIDPDVPFLQQLANLVSIEDYVANDPLARPRVVITGANLQVRACEPGAASSTCAGKGNVVVGHNAQRSANDSVEERAGWHNLVVGDGHWFNGRDNFIAGYRNTVYGDRNVVAASFGSNVYETPAPARGPVAYAVLLGSEYGGVTVSNATGIGLQSRDAVDAFATRTQIVPP